MPTHTELFEVALREALSRSTDIKETTARQDGSRLNALLHAMAAMGEEIDLQRQLGLVQTVALDAAVAAGDYEAASKIGADRYLLPIAGATASVGELELVRTASTPAVTITAGTEILVKPAGLAAGVKVRTDTDVTIADSSTGPVSVKVTSLAAGRDQNVPGATATLTITGSTPQSGITAQIPTGTTNVLAGGNDLEDLLEYVDRVRRWWRNVQKGTEGAIENAALAVPQVREASLWVARNELGRPEPAGNLVISDRDGNSNSTLKALVEANLGSGSEYAPAGFYTTVLLGQVTYRLFQYRGVWLPGRSTASNQLIVAEAIAAAVNRLNPNAGPSAAQAPDGTKISPSIVTSAMRATGFFIEGTEESVSPTGIEAPESGYMFRTTPDRVSQVT